MLSNQFNFKNNKNITVGTFFGIGQNYSKHALEMGSQVSKEPTIFTKPPQAYLNTKESFILPKISTNVHYEVELVVVISKDCLNIQPEHSKEFIAGYGVGIDFTLRDLQKQAKDKGKPWSVAKGFLGSAAVSEILEYDNSIDFNSFFLELQVNGEQKQHSPTAEMDKSVEFLISYLSNIFGLRKGDAIFTGTPEGVGPIISGDKVTALLKDKDEKLVVDLEVNVE